jgi:hypothetical protein
MFLLREDQPAGCEILAFGDCYQRWSRVQTSSVIVFAAARSVYENYRFRPREKIFLDRKPRDEPYSCVCERMQAREPKDRESSAYEKTRSDCVFCKKHDGLSMALAIVEIETQDLASLFREFENLGRRIGPDHGRSITAERRLELVLIVALLAKLVQLQNNQIFIHGHHPAIVIARQAIHKSEMEKIHI